MVTAIVVFSATAAAHTPAGLPQEPVDGGAGSEIGNTFRITKVVLCKSAPIWFGAYETQPPGHRYALGDTIHFYIEMQNAPYLQTRPGQWNMELDRKTTIRDARGNIFHQSVLVAPRGGYNLGFEPTNYFNHHQLGNIRFPPGHYTFSFEVTDRRTRQTAKGSVPFMVADEK
jgi:hypothetical protein